MNLGRALALGAAILALGAVLWAGYIWAIYYRNDDAEPPGGEFNDALVTEDLGGGFHVVYGAGGNITVLTGPDGALIVDTGLARRSDDVRRAVDAIVQDRVVWVINTHSHHDHRGGNFLFAEVGAQIVAHEIADRAMRSDSFNPATPQDYPTLAIKDGHKMRFNGQEITAIHTPQAHTAGDVIVRFEPADVVVAGDVVIEDGLPFISLGGGATLAGHLDGQSIILGLAGPDTRIVAGHGRIGGRADLVALNADLQKLHRRLVRLKSLSVPAKFLPLLHAARGWPEARWKGYGWEKFWLRLAYATLE